MNQLYPIIRRVRRALLPPEETRTEENRKVCERPALTPIPSPPGEGEARAVVELPPVVAPVEVVTVEMAPVVSEVLATPPVVATADQSLLTSAATKGMKSKQAAAKSRVKAIDEAHSAQP